MGGGSGGGPSFENDEFGLSQDTASAVALPIGGIIVWHSLLDEGEGSPPPFPSLSASRANERFLLLFSLRSR